jgi:membrane fusion protein (multidrug efflux system)
MSFPNPDGLLRPNGFGRVRLLVGKAENALLIPQKAVIEQQGGSAVFVIGADNKVSQRTVVLGPQFESSVVVTQGLKAGERIIVEGQQKARPGMPVNPYETAITSEEGKK